MGKKVIMCLLNYGIQQQLLLPYIALQILSVLVCYLGGLKTAVLLSFLLWEP